MVGTWFFFELDLNGQLTENSRLARQGDLVLGMVLGVSSNERGSRSMRTSNSQKSVLRFGAFELDSRAGELRKGGTRIKLPPQPVKVLALLVSRAGELVSREEVRRELWGEDTFVDVEQGLGACISRIRMALLHRSELMSEIRLWWWPRYVSSMKYPKRCQYKHAKQKKYHVRNCSGIQRRACARRGDLTVWFDEEAIANWKFRQDR